jgi:hypothetical protein
MSADIIDVFNDSELLTLRHCDPDDIESPLQRIPRYFNRAEILAKMQSLTRRI